MESYMLQLEEVTKALMSPECKNKEELIDMQNDLMELIQLMQQKAQNNADDTVLEDDCTVEDPSQQFDDLIGSPCMASVSELNSSLQYHCAVIVDVDTKNEQPHVKISFSHPLTTSMKYCPYYIKSSCNYEDKCKFSHGEWRVMDDIRPYTLPNFDDLCEGQLCLVCCEKGDSLWKLARVTDVCLNEQKVAAQVLDTGEECAFSFDKVYPIADSDLKPTDSVRSNDEEPCSSSSINQINDGDGSFAQKHQRAWVHKSLGTWETHTKGIGSKLMAKMGYVVGSGLGKDSMGRVEPVEAKILPKKTSLDRCSEHVKVLKTQSKKQNQLKRLKNVNKPSAKTMFKFINDKLLAAKKGRSSESVLTHKKLKDMSDKDLNVRLLALQDQIKHQEGPTVKKTCLVRISTSTLSKIKADVKLLADEIKNRRSRRDLMNF